MNYNANEIISQYLRNRKEVFTVDQFQNYLKDSGVKITKQELNELLHTSDYIFPLIDNQFVTRAGAFSQRWFSFKPSKEEVDKGYFIIGHRCMPFCSLDRSPDNICIEVKGKKISPEPIMFSMNLALDTFAFFGDGFVIPYILSDKSNTTVNIASVKYSLPTEVCLTAWPLAKIAGKKTFTYGDRIVCRVIDWDNSVIEMYRLPNETNKMIISEQAIKRENWYKEFEEGLLRSFEKHGPTSSIELQLAFLFLENQEELCLEYCGSCEEFMEHTNKIGISPYGVESRIWYANKIVPYSGPWNILGSDELIMNEVVSTFSPQIIDAYLEDNIYDEYTEHECELVDNLLEKMFPHNINMSVAERKVVLLNIKKRRDILKRKYNRFSDYHVAYIRKQALELFTRLISLLCSIGCSGIKCEDFPQQELVILTQLYTNTVRILEEIESIPIRDLFPVDDVSVSIDGMSETFDDINEIIVNSLEQNRYKGFEIV